MTHRTNLLESSEVGYILNHLGRPTAMTYLQRKISIIVTKFWFLRQCVFLADNKGLPQNSEFVKRPITLYIQIRDCNFHYSATITFGEWSISEKWVALPKKLIKSFHDADSSKVTFRKSEYCHLVCWYDITAPVIPPKVLCASLSES